jgi:membrane-bound lytic murein transglycosylase D
MNKLLLLATSLLCLNLEGYSTGIPNQAGAPLVQSATDSTIKDQVSSDPKNGFKDLFEATANNESFTHKLNPKAVSFVQDYVASDGERLEKMKDWGKPFFDKINTVFTRYEIPVELKYLAVIESDLKSSATSSVGAAGPWQFMPTTARELGLKVSRKVDERRDFNKSTAAAARYLSDLYEVYNDWLLVIAAYNGGPGNVNAAIRKSGSRNFWDLQYHLPAESRNHVKKFIATHYIMEGDGGLTTLTKKETEAYTAVVDASTAMINVSGKYNSGAIMQVVGIDMMEFNRLNPNFDRQLSASGSYELRLPNDKMLLFQANKPMILDQSIRLMVNMAR